MAKVTKLSNKQSLFIQVTNLLHCALNSFLECTNITKHQLCKNSCHCLFKKTCLQFLSIFLSMYEIHKRIVVDREISLIASIKTSLWSIIKVLGKNKLTNNFFDPFKYNLIKSNFFQGHKNKCYYKRAIESCAPNNI